MMMNSLWKFHWVSKSYYPQIGNVLKEFPFVAEFLAFCDRVHQVSNLDIGHVLDLYHDLYFGCVHVPCPVLYGNPGNLNNSIDYCDCYIDYSKKASMKNATKTCNRPHFDYIYCDLDWTLVLADYWHWPFPYRVLKMNYSSLKCLVVVLRNYLALPGVCYRSEVVACTWAYRILLLEEEEEVVVEVRRTSYGAGEEGNTPMGSLEEW